MRLLANSTFFFEFGFSGFQPREMLRVEQVASMQFSVCHYVVPIGTRGRGLGDGVNHRLAIDGVISKGLPKALGIPEVAAAVLQRGQNGGKKAQCEHGERQHQPRGRFVLSHFESIFEHVEQGDDRHGDEWPNQSAHHHAAEQEWIEKMRQFQNKPAPVEFIPVSPSTLPEMEHPYQLSGPKWEPPTLW